MKIFLLVWFIVMIYLLNMIICASYHYTNATRGPRNTLDFMKLTFLPYVIFYDNK